METMKIDKICRACLRKDDKMIDMNEKEIYQKFLVFTNLSAEDFPDIPLNLCRSCEQKLNSALDFKEECQQSHEILLNYVQNTCEVKLEATDEVDSEPTADVNTLSRLEQISQDQVLEAIKDLKQSICKNTNCIWCSYVGNNSMALSRHVSLVHWVLKPHWCCVCNAEFDNLTDHIAMKHSNDYSCKFCSRKFQSITRLTDHLRNHSDVKPFRCSFCNKYFIKPSYLNVHLRIHTKEKPYKCDSCYKSFSQQYCLKNHLLQVHKSEGDADKQLAALELKKHTPVNNAPHKCTYCDKQFKIRSHLVEHERKHTGHKPFVCQVCENRFGYRSALKIHMMVHNIGNKISCHICNKKFSRPLQLRVHLRRHTGEKPFVCNECGKGFIESRGLIKHNKIHSDVRPYQCSNCDKLFREKTQLKRHMLMHSGEKPYKCNQCLCAYKSGHSLTQHMKQHELDQPQADRPHVCLMCNNTFTTDALLTSHINTHTIKFLEI